MGDSLRTITHVVGLLATLLLGIVDAQAQTADELWTPRAQVDQLFREGKYAEMLGAATQDGSNGPSHSNRPQRNSANAGALTISAG